MDNNLLAAIAIVFLVLFFSDSRAQDCLYNYRATITEVYDGDTVTADIDLGLNVWMHDEKLRLFGINAPEVRGVERPDGLVSRDWLRERIMGKTVTIETIQDSKGKYGRWLATVYADGVDMNQALVENGLAVSADY